MTIKSLAAAALLACALLAAAPGDEKARELDLSQQAFARAIQKAAPSVVTIETLGGTQAGGGELFKQGKQPQRAGGFRQAVDAQTTGLVVSADGLVITSAFNFETQPQIITVILADGREFVARLVARDFSKGLALLKIEARDLPVPRAVPPETIRPGLWAIALGRAYAGKSPSAHFGIVSATNRISGKALQTDAPTSPVNYGGPLVDLAGDVLGVIVPLSPRGMEVGWYDSGIGFAIPLAFVLRDLPALIKAKTLHPGYLGVQLADDHDGAGAKLAQVLPGSAAQAAGLAAGDVILEVDGRKIANRFDLLFQIGTRHAGDEVTLLVLRGGKQESRKATLGKTPPPPQAPARPTPMPPDRPRPPGKK